MRTENQSSAAYSDQSKSCCHRKGSRSNYANRSIFPTNPPWFSYIMTVVIVLLSGVSGFRLGKYIRRRRKSENEAPIRTIVGAMLGLLAFILGFTFAMTASRFDARKQALLDEVNAIGTAFLCADFLPDPQRMETRKLLRKYVDIRTEATQQAEKLQQALQAVFGLAWCWPLRFRQSYCSLRILTEQQKV